MGTRWIKTSAGVKVCIPDFVHTMLMSDRALNGRFAGTISAAVLLPRLVAVLAFFACFFLLDWGAWASLGVLCGLRLLLLLLLFPPQFYASSPVQLVYLLFMVLSKLWLDKLAVGGVLYFFGMPWWQCLVVLFALNLLDSIPSRATTPDFASKSLVVASDIVRHYR